MPKVGHKPVAGIPTVELSLAAGLGLELRDLGFGSAVRVRSYHRQQESSQGDSDDAAHDASQLERQPASLASRSGQPPMLRLGKRKTGTL